MSAEAANYAHRVCKLMDGPARHVLGALGWRSKTETPHQVYMKHSDLIEDTGIKTVGGIKKIIRRLVAANEVRVVEVGGRVKGRALATDYELVGVRQWIEAGKPERRGWNGPVADGEKVLRGADAATAEEGKVLRGAEKVLPGDGKVLRGAEKAKPRNTHIQDTSVNSEVEPAPAASPPSPPTPITGEGSEQNRAQTTSPPLSEALPQSRSTEKQDSASHPKSDCGGAEQMPEKRKRQIEAAYRGDDEKWGGFLETVPEFEGKDVPAVINEYNHYCRNKNVSPNRYQLVSWLCRQGAKVNMSALRQGAPRQRTTADEYYNGIERRVGGIKAEEYRPPQQTALERSLEETRRKYARSDGQEDPPARKWTPQNWLALEYIRERHAAGTLTSGALNRFCEKAVISGELVTQAEPPVHLMPEISEDERRAFRAKVTARETKAAPAPAAEEIPDRWTGAADAEAFAAEMEPQLAGAGA
jgi:hypothetical protein